MRLLRSLSFRLTLLYFGLFGASIAVLCALFYWIGVARPLDEVRDAVAREAKAAADAYILSGGDELLTRLANRARAPATRKAFHAFIDENGRTVSANLPSWPSAPAEGWLALEADLYRDGVEEDNYAILYDRVFSDGARLLIGRDAEDIEERQEQLTEALAWILGVSLLLALLGGAVMSRAIGGRLDAINRTARKVIEGDLSGRVPLRGSGDDFDRLSETLNVMLGRISESFSAVRRVSDSVAHELRTPLARLLVRLDALKEAPPGEASARLIEEALDDAIRLNRTFDALLRVARIESGRHVAGMRRVDLSALAADAAEFYAPDAEARSIALSGPTHGPLFIRADHDLVFQMTANLIDNALKYTPVGGAVAVDVKAVGDSIALSISDNGRGVGASDRERLTERFYRGEGVDDVPGEGLGLSLVAAVAERHRARLAFVDNSPGLRVEIAFEPWRAP